MFNVVKLSSVVGGKMFNMFKALGYWILIVWIISVVRAAEGEAELLVCDSLR